MFEARNQGTKVFHENGRLLSCESESKLRIEGKELRVFGRNDGLQCIGRW